MDKSRATRLQRLTLIAVSPHAPSAPGNRKGITFVVEAAALWPAGTWQSAPRRRGAGAPDRPPAGPANHGKSRSLFSAGRARGISRDTCVAMTQRRSSASPHASRARADSPFHTVRQVCRRGRSGRGVVPVLIPALGAARAFRRPCSTGWTASSAHRQPVQRRSCVLWRALCRATATSPTRLRDATTLPLIRRGAGASAFRFSPSAAASRSSTWRWAARCTSMSTSCPAAATTAPTRRKS